MEGCRTEKESSMQKHVGRVMKRMNVKVQRESKLFKALARVDFRFLATPKRVKEGTIVAMEVDGPSHFLLELPSDAGAQLPAGPGGPATAQIHSTVDGAVIDGSKHLGDIFASVYWGVLRVPATACPCCCVQE